MNQLHVFTAQHQVSIPNVLTWNEYVVFIFLWEILLMKITIWLFYLHSSVFPNTTYIIHVELLLYWSFKIRNNFPVYKFRHLKHEICYFLDWGKQPFLSLHSFLLLPSSMHWVGKRWIVVQVISVGEKQNWVAKLLPQSCYDIHLVKNCNSSLENTVRDHLPKPIFKH